MSRFVIRNCFRLFFWVICFPLLVFLSTIKLESVPPFAWDEGWTSSVARNWVERGIYGRLLKGNPVPPGLEAAFTVTLPVAGSFRLFGVGIWQARIVGLFFLAGAVALIYVLAGRLYNRTIAGISVAALFLTATIFPQLHPILAARQVMAEMPMLFLVLGGYFCFYLGLSRSLWFMPLAVLLWASGAITKGQAQPFLAVSLIVPLTLTIWSRQWKVASLIGCGMVSTYLIVHVLYFIQKSLPVAPAAVLPDIYGVVAVVPILHARWLALQVSLFLLPIILGVLYEVRNSMIFSRLKMKKTDIEILRVALLGFTGSWLAWYVFASNAYPRYVFPACFVGSVFVAKLLRDLMDSEIEVFAWKNHKNSEIVRIRHAKVSPDLFLALLFITVWSLSTVIMLYGAYFKYADESVKQVAQFLNEQTPPDALIETYDSELYPLLNRRYHYPPDSVHLDLIRRSFKGNFAKVKIDYDPLAANPDYLVVGDFMKGLRLYDPVLRTDAFHLIQRFNQYDIYKRAK